MVGKYMVMCLHSQLRGQAQSSPYPPASVRDKNLANIQSKRRSIVPSHRVCLFLAAALIGFQLPAPAS